ncbi:UDP-N-acetylmuramoyl-tripeptide--D-alanyl-D-alanine ligase [Aquirhabdus parva]|uniref:UDP-N-acetylmuramoyl-tripeptide--D-alanyl-D-alanine ligase n=1 Tax=Aquirhabdus parva TaxID=2283318 RepID=A0A345PA79_9GAMM|nr:UDP-N-acetylmuramoyl-tripeptide--D-alanyl-D-alanine ligase [Aquirhabdus parva]
MTDLSTPPDTLPLWTATALAAATGGTWHGLQPDHTPSIARIISNTRQIQAQDAFLALIGERFDAHDFAQDAIAKGAVALIVSRLIPDVAVPQLLVDDTRLALGRAGAARRASFPALQTTALTGSSGKTTTKEMLGSILRAHSSSAEVLVTRGNLNNDLGVPMMLLELTPQHHYAVMELGANHLGEIGYTTTMVKPHVAGVLNIGTAHVGEFGGRAGIARAKSEIFLGLDRDGIAIIPAQGDFHDVIAEAAKSFRTIRFGGDASNSDVYASDIQLLPTSSIFTLNTPLSTDQQSITVHLPFAGAHNVENALAAAAFAQALNIPLTTIAAGLAEAQSTKGRLNFIKHSLTDTQLTLIDDTYNANPHSMRAAAQVLTAQVGARLMVLGDIGELGDSAASEHRLLGHDLAKLPLDAVFAVGQFAQDTTTDIQGSPVQTQAFTSKDQLFVALTQWLQQQRDAKQPQITILFKGSRSTQMETLITSLETFLNEERLQQDLKQEHDLATSPKHLTTDPAVTETR